MRELLVDLAEPLAVVAYAALASALTALGLTMEWMGLLGGGGQFHAPGLWLAYMGAVLLAAGATVARRKLLPALRAALAA